jgi:hypothetical protein
MVATRERARLVDGRRLPSAFQQISYAWSGQTEQQMGSVPGVVKQPSPGGRAQSAARWRPSHLVSDDECSPARSTSPSAGDLQASPDVSKPNESVALADREARARHQYWCGEHARLEGLPGVQMASAHDNRRNFDTAQRRTESGQPSPKDHEPYGQRDDHAHDNGECCGLR